MYRSHQGVLSLQNTEYSICALKKKKMILISYWKYSFIFFSYFFIHEIFHCYAILNNMRFWHVLYLKGIPETIKKMKSCPGCMGTFFYLSIIVDIEMKFILYLKFTIPIYLIQVREILISKSRNVYHRALIQTMLLWYLI